MNEDNLTRKQIDMLVDAWCMILMVATVMCGVIILLIIIYLMGWMIL